MMASSYTGLHLHLWAAYKIMCTDKKPTRYLALCVTTLRKMSAHRVDNLFTFSFALECIVQTCNTLKLEYIQVRNQCSSGVTQVCTCILDG